MKKNTKINSPKNICDAAREAAELDKNNKAIIHLANQQKKIRSVVGEDLFPQCIYDPAVDQWTICGRAFRCNSRWLIVGYQLFPPNEFHNYIDSLASLGHYLERVDREEKEKIKQLPVTKEPFPAIPTVSIELSVEPKALSWAKRIDRAFHSLFP